MTASLGGDTQEDDKRSRRIRAGVGAMFANLLMKPLNWNDFARDFMTLLFMTLFC